MSIARSPGPPGGRRGLVIAVTLVAASLGAITAWRLAGSDPPALPPAALRLVWTMPDELQPEPGGDQPFGLALSPDGRFVALASARDGAPAPLVLYAMDGSGSRAIPGTDGAVQPFWSPDGARLAFFAGGRLRHIALDGSGGIDLAAAPAPRGGVWHSPGTIVFTPDAAGGLLEVPEAGGDPRPVTTPDTTRGDTGHHFPQMARGGDVIVFFVASTDTAREGVWALDRSSGETARLAPSAAHALALGDLLVVRRDDGLVAERLAARRLGLDGRGVFLTRPVGRGERGELWATTSASGVLIALPPPAGARRLQWFDADGEPGEVVADGPGIGVARIAPDGRTLAFVQPEPMLGTLDVWVAARGQAPRRVSSSIDIDDTPVWAPGGGRLAWVQARQAVVTRGALAELDEQTAWRSAAPKRVSQWTSDGAWLVVSERSARTGEDIWIVSPSGGEPRAYLTTPASEHSAAVSPDGRWAAWASDASGTVEVYADGFPEGTGAPVRLTTGGGTEPRWTENGRAVIARRGRELLRIPVSMDAGSLVAGEASVVFVTPGEVRGWDVSADGRQLILNLPVPGEGPRPGTALVNWPSLGGWRW